MNYQYILKIILDMGTEMVVCGAEVSRVEDSIRRMCTSYGFTNVNVFIITSNVQVTVETPEKEILTQIRRISRQDVNFDRVDYLNDLSRYVCQFKPSYEDFYRRYEDILKRPAPSFKLKTLGAILVAGGFTVFFGGTIKDAFAASIMGVAIVLIERFLDNRENNQIVYYFITSFVAGLVALLLVMFKIGNNEGTIMIGGIMLLIPGIAMTNGVRDMLIGDTVSGLLRLINALLVAGSIACGFAVSIIFLGGAI